MKKEKRDESVSIPLSKQERGQVEKIAQDEGTSMSTIVRRSLFKDLRSYDKESK